MAEIGEAVRLPDRLVARSATARHGSLDLGHGALPSWAAHGGASRAARAVV